MKILFVTNMWPDAARPWHGTFVRSLADSLRSIGITVDVLHVRGWSKRSEYATGAIKALKLNRRSQGYDVVHAHYGHSGVLGRLQLRSPLVISYCGDDLLGTVTPGGGRSRRSMIEAALFRQLARLAGATITRTREMELRLPPSCRPRNSIIPSPVDLSRFTPGPREEARRELGWETDEKVALFVGDPDVAAKNYPLAEQAFGLARQRQQKLRLQVATQVPHDRVPTLMRASDALLFTSTSEGSPNAVKEAMACALPVVSTPVGDVPDRLTGVEGCFIRPPQPEQLADALVEAVALGRADAARRAVKPLDLEASALRVKAVYESVV